MVLPIGVYWGGRIVARRFGYQYDPDVPKMKIRGSEDMQLSEVKRYIYQKMNLSETRFDLTILNRVQVGTNGDYHYQLFRIDNQADWLLALQYVRDREYYRIHLFVEVTDRFPNQNVEASSSVDRGVRNLGLQGNEEEEEEEIGVQTGSYSNKWSFYSSTPIPRPVYASGLQIESESDDENWKGPSESEPSDNETDTEETITSDIPYFEDISELQKTEDEVCFGGKLLKGEIGKGTIFASKKQLTNAVKEWHVKKNYRCRTPRSDKKELYMYCGEANSPCQWMLYAKPLARGVDGQWQIRKVGPAHSCFASLSEGVYFHPNLSSDMIAEAIVGYVREKPSMDIKTVVQHAHSLFGANIKDGKAWRAREKALGKIFGSWEDAYALIPRLLGAISETNPETRYTVNWEDGPNLPSSKHQYFTSAAWAFGPCIRATRWIRPVVSIDACHLSGRYAGRLLTLVGYDGDGHNIPLAFGIVDQENTENWGWWLKWVKEEVLYPRKWCVISDRHAGIKAVFRSEMYGWNEENGEAHHRYCVQHLSENVYRRYRSKDLVGIFKWTAKR